jgi:hypothetical protein
MRRSFTAALPLGFALLLAGAAPAFATNVYIAEGTDESPLATCQPIAGSPTYFQCGSLRAAVEAANANPNADGDLDLIWLQATGTYTVASALALTDDVVVTGRGPRTTAVRAGGASRVFEVAPGQLASLQRLTVAGGRAGGGDGGNILNQGTLLVGNARVTDGTAANGGGIANIGGSLSLINSLVDHNAAQAGVGGGIVSRGGDDGADLAVFNSTVAFNAATVSGGGIATAGTVPNQTSLTAATIARNTISNPENVAGLSVAPTGETAFATASLFGENRNTNGLASCSTGRVEDPGATRTSVEDGSSCFDAVSGDLGLSTELVDRGGDTPVVTIPAGSPAKNVVPEPCIVGVDQRSAPRSTGACDAGAFEEGAEAPPVEDAAFPEPVPVPPDNPQPPPPPPPVPTPTPTPEPTPVVNQSVVVKPVEGKVRVRAPGSGKFVELEAGAAIPTGSTVDTRNGTVELSSVPKAGGAVQTARFFDGIFKVTQKRGITDLKLTEKLARCGKRGARAAAKKAKKRRLWGDGKGSFRTTGRYSAATVRGTKWLVQDSCAGTLTRVKAGSVKVRDNVRKRTKVVRAGGKYLARPKR